MKVFGLTLFAALVTVLGFAVASPISIVNAVQSSSKQSSASTFSWSSLASSLTSGSQAVAPRFVSYNIRMAVDSALPPEPPWSTRLPKLITQLESEVVTRPETLLCMQEALSNQVSDISDGLGDPWTHIGVGRDDGKSKGEFSPIFYRTDTWDLEDWKTYWLSETPDKVGSKGWDASLPRIATVARLSHRDTGLPLVYMCTHFDHKGQKAQVESAKLIANIASEWAGRSPDEKVTEGTCDAASDPVPVLLGGDLNIEPGSAGYQQMVAEGAFDNVLDIVDSDQSSGYKNTYTGFDDEEKEAAVLDYVFVWRPDARDMELTAHSVFSNKDGEGVWISDHRPVVVDTRFAVDKGCAPKS